MIDLKGKQLLFFDFDGTLVETKSGNTFPTDLADMVLKMDVINRAADLIVKNDIEVIGICSNQGGIELGYVDFLDINAKIRYVGACIDDLVRNRRKEKKGITFYVRVCDKNDKSDPNRKPNPGMLDDVVYMAGETGFDFDKDQMLMVGDASGFAGQFSNSDRRCAENFGIDYMDVVDFVGKDIVKEVVLSPSKLKIEDVEFLPEERKIVVGPNPYSVQRLTKVYLHGYVDPNRLHYFLGCEILQDPYTGQAEFIFGTDIIETKYI